MPGILEHSAAAIVRQLLADLGHATVGRSPWPIYIGQEPEMPDNTVTVYDTVGRQQGRTMGDGERQEHHGIQIRVRAANYAIGYAKSREIAVAMDEDVYDATVEVDDVEYNVHTVIRLGDIIPFPKPATTGAIPKSLESRNVFVTNCLVSVRQVTEDAGQDSLTELLFGEISMEEGTGTGSLE